MSISICIPTCNRAEHLANCLKSIVSNDRASELDLEICVSDNGSTDDTERVVRQAGTRLAIKYERSPQNRGIPWNFLNVVSMAEGEFVWLLGDDDFLLSGALAQLSDLMAQHPRVDFFCINSFIMTAEQTLSAPRSFDASHLPGDATPYSSRTDSGEMDFMELIDPRISFDFLGGMFLSVFRRRNWTENADALDAAAVSDLRPFAHFDSTFPHVKIFARAFANSRAFFHAEPLSVCLKGVREWTLLSPFVTSVRLVEALDEYRKNGLPYCRYLWCKNYALRNFLPDLAFMVLHRSGSGLNYVRPMQLIRSNFLYPNVYLSPLHYLASKTKGVLHRLVS